MAKLTYPEAMDIASKLRSKASDMESLLNGSISTEYNKIGSGGNVWRGTAADEAKAKFDEFKSKFNAFSAAIEECAKYLESVVARSESTDAELRKFEI